MQGKEQRPPLHLGVIANEKGAFGSPSIRFADFTYWDNNLPITFCIYQFNYRSINRSTLYVSIFEWLVELLWHINHSRLFNAKFSLYIHILNIYDLDWLNFSGILSIAGYFIPNPIYIYIYRTHMIWFDWVLWYIDHCRFYDISTIVGYFMPNSLYTYIYWIHMILFG